MCIKGYSYPVQARHREVRIPIVLCKICSVFCLLEQPRVDNFSTNTNWEQLVQLAIASSDLVDIQRIKC